MTPLAELIFAALVGLAPPERFAAMPQIVGHEESAIERRSRYVAIAIDLEDAVNARPPLPGYTRRGTAALALGIAWKESAFAHEVDVGPCQPGTCDGGRAACMMQVHVPDDEREALFRDRVACFAKGIERARQSLVSCNGELTAYAVGFCDSIIGRALGRARIQAGVRVEGLFSVRAR